MRGRLCVARKTCLVLLLLHGGGEKAVSGTLLTGHLGRRPLLSVYYRFRPSPVTVSVCGRPSGSKGRVEHPGRRMTHAALPVKVQSPVCLTL
jgi:hypothetical protein